MGQDHAEPSTGEEPEAEVFPQWGIAVLVIGLAAIAFVVIFGVSMVSTKTKTSFFGDGESSRHTFKNANFFAVFWIRIQLNPDPAKTLNPDPDHSYFLTLSEKKKNTS